MTAPTDDAQDAPEPDGLEHDADMGELVARLGLDPPPDGILACARPGGRAFANCEVEADSRSSVPVSQSADLYVASGTFRDGTISETKGRKAANVERVLWLGADIDLGNRLAAERAPELRTAGGRPWTDFVKNTVKPLVLAMAEEEIAPALAELQRHSAELVCAAGLPEPTVWVESGNGIYAWWSVTPEAGADQRLCVTAARAAIERFNREAGYPLSDPTHDAGSRVFRMPGSWNLKNPDRPRRARWLDGGTGEPLDLTTVEQLAASLPVPEKKSKAQKAKPSATDSGTPAERTATPRERVPVPRKPNGKLAHCWNCGQSLEHGYRHNCGSADCVECPKCGAPQKGCQAPGEFAARMKAHDDRASAGTLAELLHRGLLDQPAENVTAAHGPAAIVEAVSFYTTPAESWRVGTDDRPHPFDDVLTGFRVDEPFLALAIAAPGGFKSAAAMHIATSVAARGEPVVYVGYEDKPRRRVLRMLAAHARVSMGEIVRGTLLPRDEDRLVGAGGLLAQSLATLRLICEQRSVSPIGIAQAAEKLVADLATGDAAGPSIPFIVVDALQNVAPLGVLDDRDRRREIDSIMAAFEWIRDRLPARLLVLSHAARGGDPKDGGYNVSLHGAKESSGVEYAADVGITLHPRRVDDGGDPRLTRLLVKVEKHRAAAAPFDVAVAVEPDSGLLRVWTGDDRQRWQRCVEREAAEASVRRSGKNGKAAGKRERIA